MVNLKIILGILLFGLMVFSACNSVPPPQSQCVNDSDCGSGEVCINNYCEISNSTVNLAPVVNAGNDFSVNINVERELNGSVSDDGLPDNTLTSKWTQVSGPGEVIFQDPSLVNTNVSFNTVGEYTLRLTADDGELSNDDDVVITATQKKIEPTCSDGVQNQDETGVDCGGSVCDVCLSEKLKIVSASQNASYQEDANPIENAYDGDLQSRWAARPIPSEITFDLGETQQVGETKFLFYNNDQGRIYKYSIDTSTDNTHWTPVVTEKNSNEGFTIDTFTPLSARYIRLNFISQNQGDWAGLYEAEVWSSYEKINPPKETCTDGIKNQDETGIDCGGTFCPPCNNIVPSASISSPNNGSNYSIGDTVSFSGTVTDSDSSSLKISWLVDRMGDGLASALIKEENKASGTTSGSISMSGTKTNTDGQQISLQDEGATYELILVADDGINSPVEKTTSFTLNSAGDISRLSVSPQDSHYLINSKGEPIFIIGHHDALGWWKGKKWSNVRDTLKSTIVDNHLSFAKIQLPIQGPTEDVDLWTYKRTGPGKANDGGPKFDLMSLNPAFWDELENLLAWGDTNDVYLQISLFSGIAFKSRSDNYAWPGAVFNPDNRINMQAGNVGYKGQNPDMYDVFDSSAGWVSENDRKWMRNRLKALVDELLKRGASYKNWWVEIGIENNAPKDWKEYWIHYIHGDTNPIDDHAVSPYAIPDLIIEDNSDYGADMGGTGLVQAQEVHNVVSSNVASKVDGMYSDPILALANTDGSETTDVSNNRRMAWISLTHGGHFSSYDEVNPANPPSFLTAFRILMNFIEKDRGGHTIEHVLPLMHPDQNIISGGHALRNDNGETERYLVFALAGINPSIQISSAGLSIVRIDTTTGTETVVGTTKVGSNTLVGTGHDTGWWIEK